MARLLFDKDFVRWLKKQTNASVFRSLMYVNNSSLDHKRGHAIIPKSEYQILLDEKDVNKQTFFEASFVPKDPPEYLKKEMGDTISFMVRYAAYLTNEEPFQVFIMTSPENRELYEKNPHFKDLKKVSIKSNEDALTIIDDYWEQYKLHKS